METVKVKLYYVEIYESTSDVVHGFKRKIREIWIPTLGICFNEEGYAFCEEGPRVSGALIDTVIDKSLADDILFYVKAKSIATPKIERFFKDREGLDALRRGII